MDGIYVSPERRDHAGSRTEGRRSVGVSIEATTMLPRRELLRLQSSECGRRSQRLRR